MPLGQEVDLRHGHRERVDTSGDAREDTREEIHWKWTVGMSNGRSEQVYSIGNCFLVRV